MSSKKHQNGAAPNQIQSNGSGRGGSNDLQTRAAFTSAIVAALKELEGKKAPETKELGQRAYQKLQYDLPLASPEELEGLTDILRASLQLKSGQPLLPITSKLLENVVTGARAPVPVGPAPLSLQSESLSSAAAISSNHGGAGVDVGTGAVAGSEEPPNAVDGVSAPTAKGIWDSAGGTVAQQAPAAAATQDPLSSGLVDTGLLNPDRARLCGAFRALCAVIFVQLVSHALAVSEQGTWALLYGIGTGQEDGEEEDGEEEDGSGDAEARRRESAEGAEARAQATATAAAQDEEQPGPSARLRSNGVAAADRSSARHDLGDGSGGPASTDPDRAPGPLEPPQSSPPPPQQPRCLYEEPQAAEEDGDDFVFEDLEAPCSSSSAAAAAAATGVKSAAGSGSWGLGNHPTVPPPPPPYSWPALRTRLLRLSGHVSYALLDEPDLWRDGQLLQGVFQLLRALGAHRHCQELQPLLHAYVGLVADRIAAEPAELACLDSLWDAVGLQCVASLPQVGRQRTAAGAARGGQGLLLAEATTCLSLVATLASQLTGASAKLRLWQQVHKHMLPLLERCLAELARTVGPGPKHVAATAKAAAQQPQQQQPKLQQSTELKAPGPEEVAAIVLVCQVLDFYVQQRPGNADLAGSLKGTGVLASLSVLFAAAAALPGAEPLRSAALCCAASSRELHAWMLAVPGLAKALAGPSFQENGAHEAHGAVWELLGNSGSSPLALSILAGGAAPEKAVRVHALLQLLDRAAACRGGLWGPAVERAMRELFAALRQEQAGGAGASASGREQGATAVAVEQQQQRNGVAGDGASGCEQSAEAASAVVEEDDDADDDKLHLLEPEALLRRRARQLHPACWRILKQLLTASGESSGKTD
ncbi:hypothetical protein PLESTB_000381100 [Pleodorina starrii]|uniref:Uncharacterized protein n=1 Tax=Pleodorina starrii TaxID=330485 RepID=A0A9W6BER7_9CHLO|nr:hypothetical protein PLESTM_000014000 [Pleodorina starrii]GLC50455.1 hypothetical protein PLESTB_000381100 [Pleodorina starrii]GLC73308.1 hypothetical protein PLESTF_001358900 [Pleodorina starrii]